MTIEDRIKVVEVVALAMDPPAVFDVETPLREVVRRMRDENVGCALLTRDGELAGVSTERDLVVRVLGNKGAFDLPVGEWMTPDPERVTRTDTVRKDSTAGSVAFIDFLKLTAYTGRNYPVRANA